MTRVYPLTKKDHAGGQTLYDQEVAMLEQKEREKFSPKRKRNQNKSQMGMSIDATGSDEAKAANGSAVTLGGVIDGGYSSGEDTLPKGAVS